MGCIVRNSSEAPRCSRGIIAIDFIASILCVRSRAYAAARSVYPRCFAIFFLQSETLHLIVPTGVPRAAAIS
jgi:hypothetical protein